MKRSKRTNASFQEHREQPRRRPQHDPLFEFSKIRRRPVAASGSDGRIHNESTGTCPLTASNFSTAEGGGSVASGSTPSSNGSGASSRSHGPERPSSNGGDDGGDGNVDSAGGFEFNRRDTGGSVASSEAAGSLNIGDDSSHDADGGRSRPTRSLRLDGGGLGGDPSRRSDELRQRCSIEHESLSASWPAESPDPLSATARWGVFESEPTEVEGGHQSASLRDAAKATGVAEAGSLYLPVRQHGTAGAKRASADKSANGSTQTGTTRVDSPRQTSKDPGVKPHSATRLPHHHMPRKSSFDVPLLPLRATIVFVDLEGYSRSSDIHQRQLTCDFMGSVRNLLTFAYGQVPSRGNVEDYVILPTGDGAAVIVIRPPCRTIGRNTERGGNATEGEDANKESTERASKERGVSCDRCSARSLRTTEETALWIGASLLLWASRRRVGLRVGLNSGGLSIVEDPYGDPNVCGDAINMAARIMDTALPGQILVSSSTVVPDLGVLAAGDLAKLDLIGAHEKVDGDDGRGSNRAIHDNRNNRRNCMLETRRRRQSCPHCPWVKYEIATQASEVVVKHGVMTNVQSVCCSLYELPRPEDLPPELQPQSSCPPLPTASSLAAGKRSTSSSLTWGNLHQSLTRPNLARQSFASLSSMVVSESQLSLEKKLGMKGTSNDTAAPGRNASWKLDLSENEAGSKRISMLSMLSQLSVEEGSEGRESARRKPSSESGTPSGTDGNFVQWQQNKQQQQQQQGEQRWLSEATVQPQHVGNHRTPGTKWYMKIKPTLMQTSPDDDQIKPKVLPQELIRRHRRIAFLGITHDNLSRGFARILRDDPGHRWDEVTVLFPSDECLRDTLVENYRDRPVEALIHNKRRCRTTLSKILSPAVADLRFLQYDRLMHCGSYWDWSDPGGFIHISPVMWGANPKTCPAMNYYWNSRVPSPEYRVYRDGLEHLLGTARPFENDEEETGDGLG